MLHYGPVPDVPARALGLPGLRRHRLGRASTGSPGTSSPRCRATTIVADFHCVTKFTIIGQRVGRRPRGRRSLELAPPAPDVTHVMVWAEYGYSANLRMADFLADGTLFATHRDGEPLTPEHGFPVRLVVPHLYAWKSVKWVRGDRVPDRRPPRLLGGARLPQRRRPLAGAALLLPGGTRATARRDNAAVSARTVTGGYGCPACLTVGCVRALPWPAPVRPGPRARPLSRCAASGRPLADEATFAALHIVSLASASLRAGLTEDSARKAVRHLRTCSGTRPSRSPTPTRLLAWDGAAAPTRADAPATPRPCSPSGARAGRRAPGRLRRPRSARSGSR